MDDYSITSLQESRNEWCSRLINILTPLVVEGFKSIFDESYSMCIENDEESKYLMTFQNFLSRVPKWNETNWAEPQRIPRVWNLLQMGRCNCSIRKY